MKKFKYLAILITIGLIIFGKTQIDKKNKKQEELLDSFDDGMSFPVKPAKEK